VWRFFHRGASVFEGIIEGHGDVIRSTNPAKTVCTLIENSNFCKQKEKISCKMLALL